MENAVCPYELVLVIMVTPWVDTRTIEHIIIAFFSFAAHISIVALLLVASRVVLPR